MRRTDSRFAAAVVAIAEEDLELESAHPPFGELQAYCERALSAPEMSRIENHLALCRHCADAAMDLLSRQRRPARSLFWNPLAGYGVAAAMLAALLVTLISFNSEPRANIHVATLAPAAARGGQGAGLEQLEVPEGAEAVLLILGLSEVEDLDRYRLELVRLPSADGETVFSTDAVRRMPDGNFTLEVGAHYLRPGRYVIRLFGWKAARQQRLAEYHFEIPSPASQRQTSE